MKEAIRTKHSNGGNATHERHAERGRLQAVVPAPVPNPAAVTAFRNLSADPERDPRPAFQSRCTGVKEN